MIKDYKNINYLFFRECCYDIFIYGLDLNKVIYTFHSLFFKKLIRLSSSDISKSTFIYLILFVKLVGIFTKSFSVVIIFKSKSFDLLKIFSKSLCL